MYNLSSKALLGIPGTVYTLKTRVKTHDRANLWLKMAVHSSGLQTLWSCNPLSATFSTLSHAAK